MSGGWRAEQQQQREQLHAHTGIGAVRGTSGGVCSAWLTLLLVVMGGVAAAGLLPDKPHLKKPDGAREATPASTSGSWLAALLLQEQRTSHMHHGPDYMGRS